MDNNKVVEAITSDTKAVLSHIQGFNGLSENLLGTLEERGILLIEDVCSRMVLHTMDASSVA